MATETARGHVLLAVPFGQPVLVFFKGECVNAELLDVSKETATVRLIEPAGEYAAGEHLIRPWADVCIDCGNAEVMKCEPFDHTPPADAS